MGLPVLEVRAHDDGIVVVAAVSYVPHSYGGCGARPRDLHITASSLAPAQDTPSGRELRQLKEGPYEAYTEAAWWGRMSRPSELGYLKADSLPVDGSDGLPEWLSWRFAGVDVDLANPNKPGSEPTFSRAFMAWRNRILKPVRKVGPREARRRMGLRSVFDARCLVTDDNVSHAAYSVPVPGCGVGQAEGSCTGPKCRVGKG
ncbi:hypothetical protein HAX54_003543 [Datura stramonium]|uniref:Uncharacterized protein n=1 Tax=Datura stramonium TaxID=4076 RepID=A0ABS8WWA2_DATST|nr:hypothetical protein [Datura stramonium]